MTSKSIGLFPEVSPQPAVRCSTGILPSQDIRHLLETGRIRSAVPIDGDQVQPASIDLRLGEVGYRIRASFLPGPRSTVSRKLASVQVAQIDLTKPYVLEPSSLLLVPLLEELALPKDISARANPKSTTGRLDIFTRLITDYGSEFEAVRPGYRGGLFAEIVSRTFTVSIQAGMALNQLRFVRGRPASFDGTIEALDQKESIVYRESIPAEADIDGGLRVSLDLRGNGDSPIVAYRARKNAPLVDLGKIRQHDPVEYWESLPGPIPGGLVLEPGDFYILGSHESVRVPPTFAAEMVPIDTSIGEFRIHYAGFFDPGFGYGNGEITGTRAVLEVRAHEVPFLVEDRQTVGRLIYSRLLEAPDRVYGSAIGSSYQRQGLTLSKQFR